MAILPNPAVATSAAYAVSKHGAPIDLKLDANEGAPPPAALLAMLTDPELMRRYPDARGLEAKLAMRLGVTRDRVLATCGADDALDRACRAFLWRGRELILPVPTFEMLPRFAALLGATAREIPWPSGPFPLEAVLRSVNENTAAIAVVSPNNPTGAVVTRAELQRLAAGAPDVVLLVDLAYAEYADEDLTATALALPNAIVFRTLSKAWGMAGLRVGYGVARAEVTDLLNRVRQPFNVNNLALAGAVAALDDHLFLAESYESNRRGMEQIIAGLKRLGLEHIPSHGNFVTFELTDAATVNGKLLKQGVIVRPFGGYGMPNHLRVTIGLEAENLRFLEALQQSL